MMMGSNHRGLPRENGSCSVESDDDGAALMVKVSHGSNLFDVSVPSKSTFGDLKRVIAQETGAEPQLQKLFFRGKEKEDDDLLQMAGVKDNSKVVLLMGNVGDKQMKPQEMNEPCEISKGAAAVAEVRAEVNKLSEQVSALEAVLYGGNKVEERNVVYLTEMLVRQLLKLDGIEAEGEGKIQRKLEVRRVQSLVETMDTLKARNSNLFSNCSNAASVTTEWETFDSGVVNPNASTPAPCSTKCKSSHIMENVLCCNNSWFQLVNTFSIWITCGDHKFVDHDSILIFLYVRQKITVLDFTLNAVIHHHVLHHL
ncbi:hypothetical protein ACH5RR_005014 [Cinchona calisaya]|uniref:BAG family molecular chaperone regulator 4 n=1 Tax=Cinchona calisaya TaxID=153742 RepID=A0ABD3AZV1_9GENT